MAWLRVYATKHGIRFGVAAGFVGLAMADGKFDFGRIAGTYFTWLCGMAGVFGLRCDYYSHVAAAPVAVFIASCMVGFGVCAGLGSEPVPSAAKLGC